MFNHLNEYIVHDQVIQLITCHLFFLALYFLNVDLNEQIRVNKFNEKMQLKLYEQYEQNHMIIILFPIKHLKVEHHE